MTVLLVTLIGLGFAYALYISSVGARRKQTREDYLDAGLSVPGWALMFAGTGIVVALLGLTDHLILIARYGLQYSHVAVGLILVTLAAALVQKRLWLAARMTGCRTLGELLGQYYGSTALRVLLLGLLFLFSVPLAAYFLAELGDLIAVATDGALPRASAIWVTGFFLFLHTVIGGWRGLVHVIAAQSVVIVALSLLFGALVLGYFDGMALFAGGIATPEGIFADRLPGVIQFSNGIGKEIAVGGVFTAVAVFSFGLSLVGIVFSPGYTFLGITVDEGRGFALKQVWLVAGLAAGILLIVGPILAVGIADAHGGATARGIDYLAGFLGRLEAFDALVAATFVLVLALSLQIAIAFLVGSGAKIVTFELTSRYLLPNLSPGGLVLAARITLAAGYIVIAFVASFAPHAAAILGTLPLSLGVQLLPAMLGLCWISWVSRGAVIAGLVFGILLVVFTEPVGLILFEALFIDLPWGRWPLTVHSAAWGLVFNVGICLLVAIFTRGGLERERRERLHDAYPDRRTETDGGAVRTAKWALMLIWAFLAIGPGAVLGNSFFSQPVFAGGRAVVGVPSLWVWQVLFWLIGVVLIWWLAYPSKLSIVRPAKFPRIDLQPPHDPLQRPRTPAWLDLLVTRLASR